MNDSALDIALLKTFVAVSETGNLSAAGTALGLSQPTVSQHIQRLEAHIGSQLLWRDKRPLGLTPAGERLLSELPALISSLEALMAAVRSQGTDQREVLRIAMSDSMSCVLGAEILAAAGKLAKNLELRAGISPWIEDSLRSGLCDLAIDCPPFASSRKTNQRFLFHDPYVIVTPRQMADIPLPRLIREKPQVAFGRNSKFGKATAQIAAEFGATELARFSLDTTHSLLRFVQSGYGWAVTSAFCLLQAPAAIPDLIVHECANTHKRNFHMLGSHGLKETDLIDLAGRVTTIFRESVTGRWRRISPQISAILSTANANP